MRVGPLGVVALAVATIAGSAAAQTPADPAARVAEVETARESGDPVRLEAALESARAGGVGAALLAVPRGDLWLARGEPDSAVAAWIRGLDADPAGGMALEALARVRLVRALVASGDAETLVALGAALLAAPGHPGSAAATLIPDGPDAAEDSLDVAGALLHGLAGEWRGRAGDPAAASALLERAARRAPTGEAGALLLAAGRWAAAAGNAARAAELWREVAVEHAETPHALEARRLLASPSRR